VILKIFCSCLLLLSVSCIPNLEDAKKKSNGPRDILEGAITQLSNALFPLAYAAEECSSSKSSGSELYVELYEVTNPALLGTIQESTGLSLICSVDIMNGKYKFIIDESLLSDKTLKAVVVDNRTLPTHQNKEIIINVHETDHDISELKTVQAQVLKEHIRDNSIPLAQIDQLKLESLKNRYDSLLLEKVIENNVNMNTSVLGNLKKMVSIFFTKVNAIYQSHPTAANYTSLISDGFNPSTAANFIVDDSSLSDEEKCHFNVDPYSSSATNSYELCDLLVSGNQPYIIALATDYASVIAKYKMGGFLSASSFMTAAFICGQLTFTISDATLLKDGETAPVLTCSRTFEFSSNAERSLFYSKVYELTPSQGPAFPVVGLDRFIQLALIPIIMQSMNSTQIQASNIGQLIEMYYDSAQEAPSDYRLFGGFSFSRIYTSDEMTELVNAFNALSQTQKDDISAFVFANGYIL
jgi:hypothetical protein